jgi:hypothetical protein
MQYPRNFPVGWVDKMVDITVPAGVQEPLLINLPGRRNIGDYTHTRCMRMTRVEDLLQNYTLRLNSPAALSKRTLFIQVGLRAGSKQVLAKTLASIMDSFENRTSCVPGSWGYVMGSENSGNLMDEFTKIFKAQFTIRWKPDKG